MSQIRPESRLEIGMADIDFRQRIEQPPQPRVSVKDGERRLSHTAEYAKSGSMDPSWSSSKGQSQCSCNTRMSTPLDSKCLMYGMLLCKPLQFQVAIWMESRC